jgi:hypothetical protein
VSHRRVLTAALVVIGVFSAVLGAVPGGVAPVRAADYRLATDATYSVRPAGHEVEVAVHATFRNTTPNPPGRFSIFGVIDLAIHAGARDVRASDRRGRLKVTVARRKGVTVATVRPRQGVRYRQSTSFTLRYVLPDAASRDVRIRSSVVTFPVWSFGTNGHVEVRLPTAFEVLVDGDRLAAERSGEAWHLTSGPIADPTRWLALLTATQPSTFVTSTAEVRLNDGAVEVQVRSWSDDRRWGRATLDLAARALPRLEHAVGLDLSLTNPLVLVESLPAAGGVLSEPTPTGTDVAIGFDEPPFTVVHQLAHAWFTPELAADQWIREGFASQAAAAVAGRLEVRRPFDPAAEASARRADAFPLVSWGAGNATERQDRYAYAASWAAAAELADAVGADALRLAWQRFAAGLDGYRPLDASPPPGQLAAVPADSRHLLDQLEAVSGKDLSAIFERWVFDDATNALLPQRREARARAVELEDVAADWGMPEPVRLALAGWRFDDAEAAIDETLGWLHDRDALLRNAADAGLSVPDRLRDEYRTGGGTAAARAELDAEAAVVADYATARGLVAGARSPVEQMGLLGGADPNVQLDEARSAFAGGDIVGAGELAREARDRLRGAARDGLVRLVSAAAVGVALLIGLVWLVRRRRQARIDGYTAGP